MIYQKLEKKRIKKEKKGKQWNGAVISTSEEVGVNPNIGLIRMHVKWCC